MQKHAFWVFVLGMALSAQTAASTPLQRGLARTAETQGKTLGCVRWQRFAVAKPTAYAPQQQSIWFKFINACPHAVWVRMAALTDDRYADSHAQLGNTMSIQPGASYGSSTTPENYFLFDPVVNRGARMWFIQYSTRPSNSNAVEMRGCTGNAAVAKKFPPCPPAVRLS